jgi:hypothetical protein
MLGRGHHTYRIAYARPAKRPGLFTRKRAARRA